MKPAYLPLVIALGLLAVLASGCMAPAPQTTTPAAETGPGGSGTTVAPVLQEIPNLTGTWTGTMKSYDDGTGFNSHENSTMVVTITEQRDRIFTGRLTITVNNTVVIFGENVAGAISRDGTGFTLAEESGYASGEILSNDEIEMIYMNDAAPFSVAIDSLKRTG